MSRQLVIHVGLPKTGSTALQSFFSRNRSALEGLGVDYLPIGEFVAGRDGRIASGNGAYLARSMLSTRDPAYLLFTLEQVGAAFIKALDATKCQTILLSSELFAMAVLEAWAPILEICRQRNITPTVLAVVRNHSDWLSSSYLQEIKRNGLTQPSAKFIRNLYKSIPFLRYYSYFSDVSKMTGAQPLLVSYDNSQLNDSLMRDVVQMLTKAEVPNLDWGQGALNVTPPPEEMLFLKIANAYRPSMTFSDVLSQKAAVASLGSPPQGKWTAIDEGLRLEISGFFADEVAKFLKEFGLPSKFFSVPCANYVDLENINLPLERVAAVFARYLVSYDKRLENLAARMRKLEDGKL